MRIDIRQVIKHFKQEVFPNKRLSVRFLSKMPKDEHGHEFLGTAQELEDGSWLIKIGRKRTHQEQLDTLLHEFAHVSRGIPMRGDSHDERFHEHLGRMHHQFYQWMKNDHHH
jgi:hypothetical protein